VTEGTDWTPHQIAAAVCIGAAVPIEDIRRAFWWYQCRVGTLENCLRSIRTKASLALDDVS
jgi:hypothetical protein